jgi:hypothetical protein
MASFRECNKKFWEELIAYYVLSIWYKESIENATSKCPSITACTIIFVAAGNALLSRYLAPIGGQTQIYSQQGDFISLLLFFQNEESRWMNIRVPQNWDISWWHEKISTYKIDVSFRVQSFIFRCSFYYVFKFSSCSYGWAIERASKYYSTEAQSTVFSKFEVDVKKRHFRVLRTPRE